MAIFVAKSNIRYIPTLFVAIDLLTYAAADNQPDRFLHAEQEDIQTFLAKIQVNQRQANPRIELSAKNLNTKYRTLLLVI